jgi:SAM-dependent methyltransferase
VLRRYLARQFACPHGFIGGLLIGNWLNAISAQMNRLAIVQLDVRAGDRLLEIGFGGGDLLEALIFGRSGTVMGVDISPTMVELAERRFRRLIRKGRLKLYRASAERLPLPDLAVHKAVSVNSLYFWPDPQGAFAELARVVKPGGRLVICFEPASELRKWPGHRFGFRLYEAEEVTALMEAAGFGRVEAAWGTGRKPARFCCLSGTRVGANG